jgi:hypothetical protein
MEYICIEIFYLQCLIFHTVKDEIFTRAKPIYEIAIIFNLYVSYRIREYKKFWIEF